MEIRGGYGPLRQEEASAAPRLKKEVALGGSGTAITAEPLLLSLHLPPAQASTYLVPNSLVGV